jgi:hypothetical protein
VSAVYPYTGTVILAKNPAFRCARGPPPRRAADVSVKKTAENQRFPGLTKKILRILKLFFKKHQNVTFSVYNRHTKPRRLCIFNHTAE